jgi:hypothetical protein
MKYFKVTGEIGTFVNRNPQNKWLRQNEIYRGEWAEDRVNIIYIHANHERDLIVLVPGSLLTEVTEEEWRTQNVADEEPRSSDTPPH